ncbi:hypothetical protein MPL1032_20622 [Mesorhizobium plurifarium]|uniref:Uncharacterized protein n=1 Tax=Mesorhizobium plurifarium TaxID=69974 RepID=A0A0K2VY54_MESPL|nr:hypothetical protein MPL1032_20622 [Mesorhizobium plurifarium]
MRDLDFGAGGLNLVARQGVHMIIDIGGACRAGAAVLTAVAISVVAAVVPVSVVAAVVPVSVVAAAVPVSVVAAVVPVSVVAAAITVSVVSAITGIRAAGRTGIGTTCRAGIAAIPASVAVPAVTAPVTVSTTLAAAVSTATAAFAGIGLGHDRTIEGETERRDNKRQHSQRSQDQPAAPALYAHPALPMPALQPVGRTTPPAMSQHKHPQSAGHKEVAHDPCLVHSDLLRFTVRPKSYFNQRMWSDTFVAGSIFPGRPSC